MTTRAVMLDFDGVLNTPRTWGKFPPEQALDRDKVERVAAWVEAVDAHVVISSAWRTGHALDDLRQFLQGRGFATAWNRVIGVTVSRIFSRRDWEIREYLARHPEIGSFVVLDDMPTLGLDRFGARFIQTNPETGVTEADLDRATAALRRRWRRSGRRAA